MKLKLIVAVVCYSFIVHAASLLIFNIFYRVFSSVAFAFVCLILLFQAAK